MASEPISQYDLLVRLHRPVIGATGGAAADLSHTADAGLVTPPGDADPLAGAAFDLAERTAGDRARHGENGCGHVEMHVEHSAMIHGDERPLAEPGGTTARPPEVRA